MEEDLSRREIAQRFARAVKGELGDNLVRVVLYGSVARGDDTSRSGVDLILVVKDRRRLGRLSFLLGDSMARTGVVIELHVVTTPEFDAMRSVDLPFSFALREVGTGPCLTRANVKPGRSWVSLMRRSARRDSFSQRTSRPRPSRSPTMPCSMRRGPLSSRGAWARGPTEE